MKRLPMLSLVGLASTAIAVSPAVAAPATPMQSAFVAGKATMTDPLNSKVVIRAEARPIYRDTELVPTMTFTAALNGFDVTLDYTNNTASPKDLGKVIVEGIMLGTVIDHWDFRNQGKALRHDRSKAPVYVTGGLAYPDEIYSPVIVLSDDQYTVGISLMYPCTEYRHSVTTHTYSVGGRPESDRSWCSGFSLLDTLDPGDSRRYTFALRVVATDPSEPNAWVRTLVPYRDYFLRTYGNIKYTPDYRPVLSVHFASPGICKPSNPRGWVEDSRRPDLNGWDGWTNFIPREMTRLHYDRVMIWAAGGCYMNNQENNFPFLTLSPLVTEPALNRTIGRLQTLPQRGPDEVGYWWGRSQQVMRRWDAPDWEPLDPNNPDHVTRAMRELGVAVDLGATAVGLDAFSYIPYYDAYHWLVRMKERAPNIKFITELDAPDIIHHLGPTFLYGHDADHSHLLADLVMPGHETWAKISMPVLEEERGRPLTAQEVQQEMRRLAGIGFVPVIMGDHAVPDRTLRATQSFQLTIPEDIWPIPVADPVPTEPEGGPDADPTPDPDPVPSAPEPEAEEPAATPPQAPGYVEDPRRTFRKPLPGSPREREDRLRPGREDRSSSRNRDSEERSSGRR